jgi:hypothetical protein
MEHAEPLQTPVVLLAFNRPVHTQRVFDTIAQIRPSRLYLVADGPRNADEAVLCDAVREIVTRVDWDCDVRRDFAATNLGLRTRISSGLNRVFEQEDRAIILEDDCVPDASFFHYCEALLHHYQTEERVMHISGDNFGYRAASGQTDSYYFSRYAHIWGWATWRRAWKLYDLDMTFWQNDTQRNHVLAKFRHPLVRRYWRHVFEAVVSGNISTWGYPWMATCLLHDGLCAMPYRNLVTNIGAGAESTHTARQQSFFTNRPLESLDLPVQHPKSVQMLEAANRHTDRLIMVENTPYGRVLQRLLFWVRPLIGARHVAT